MKFLKATFVLSAITFCHYANSLGLEDCTLSNSEAEDIRI